MELGEWWNMLGGGFGTDVQPRTGPPPENGAARIATVRQDPTRASYSASDIWKIGPAESARWLCAGQGSPGFGQGLVYDLVHLAERGHLPRVWKE